MCLGGGMGAEIIHLPGETRGSRAHLEGVAKFLFNETTGCFVVEVDNEQVAKKLFKNVPYKIIGKTVLEPSINVDRFFKVSIDRLEKAWKKPMEEIFS